MDSQLATGKLTISVAFPARDGAAGEAAVSRNRFAKCVSTKWMDSNERVLRTGCGICAGQHVGGKEGGKEGWCDEKERREIYPFCCICMFRYIYVYIKIYIYIYLLVYVYINIYTYIYLYSSLRPMAGSLRNDYVRDIEARFETSFK